MRILYLNTPAANGSGGSHVSVRNLRMLKACAGESNCKVLTLNWQSFYPLGLLLKCGLKNFPRLFYKLTFRSFRDYIRLVYCLLSFHPDILFLDNSKIMLPSGSFFRKYTTVVFFHNIESEYSRQEYRNTPGETWRITAAYEAERLLCRKANACICLNERDSLQLQKLYGRKADALLPISFTDSYCDYPNGAYGNSATVPELDNGMVFQMPFLLFVGSDFFGNTEGLFGFIENCMDKISCDLIVVGSGMEKYAGNFSQKNVHFLGYVESLAPYYEKAFAVVLPIVSGSGMKTKTCEALMYGKRIFGTEEAFEGYGAIEEADCVLCRSHEEFVKNINESLERDDTSYSVRSRNFFLKHFEDSVVQPCLSHLIETLECNSVRTGRG